MVAVLAALRAKGGVEATVVAAATTATTVAGAANVG
jgi:hypothetical protein